ncbi:mitogen-activated protein kinase kinase kinase YODA [Daucus carota subsp. sativus]|uniref:mitogen-activated protein kinase kinase kinase YODA n=1 Tax=Daucus carota subsp. sativus TaxID=79200 RepID=UPI00308319BC
MPWWAKSSSKDANTKSNKGSFIDKLHRKFRTVSEGKCKSGSGASGKQHCDTVLEHASPSPATSSSTQVSRCQSFAERNQAQPLPLPGMQNTNVRCEGTRKKSRAKSGASKGSKQFLFAPLPKQGGLPYGPDPIDAEAAVGTTSVSSDISTDSDYPSDSHLPSPHASDYEIRSRTAIDSPSSLKKTQLPITTQNNSRGKLRPASTVLNKQIPTSPKQGRTGSHVPNIQIPHYGAFCSAPDSIMSSPSRSPMRVPGPELVRNTGFWAGRPFADLPSLGSGHCSSPGSGHNSGQNSVGGDMAGQLFWQHSRCSPECSPIPSPRMTSPGPSSRIHSGAVTPLHPLVGGATESPAKWPDDRKQQGHRLPLPPITISNAYPFSPSYSTGTTPAPRSPSRTENPTSPGSCWKKGQLLGRGTFGHVYVGFNSESGEMCAMKEVTLFSDDAKSKESAQQLGQEVALLSRLRHPNIVQYLGSEMANDRLYIYLEYVSGGSIYKILQDYGQLGEAAIRSYTKQILSGLAYLHAKNTLHRDIKGANILVDPNGRVKLADFGMAKHIAGPSCPLSLKGSPYWMAPEIIKNSNACNLAVDIWSLGCTVLEMATTKPPWSQFEGVAAMFKIGHSKELPEIPDHLSDEGKDFVRLCLQRNPSDRPSAAQLLEHAFVKNAAPLERRMPCSVPSEATPSVDGFGHAKNLSCLDPGVVMNHFRGPKISLGSSDAHVLRNISCPVSPIASPFLHSRSPQGMSPRPCSSPISSPHVISGSSTPLSGGGGAIPFHLSKQSLPYSHEGMGMTQRSQNSFYPKSGLPYKELKPELFRGAPKASHIFQEAIQSEKGIFRHHYGRSAQDVGTYNGQLSANLVSPPPLKDQLKSNPPVDLCRKN